jgi:hypothetical protein
VGTLFIRKLFGHRTPPDAVELALDLTPDAITLFERADHGAWKKFAAAQLDDPEFQIVIGLLRSEVETHAGGRRPVRIWLPGEQVLKQKARIEGENPAARLRAAFDHIDRETVYRRKDVAIAVAPATRPDNRPNNQKTETTILITFAETWRESRDYAARWGFLPGDISTRHHCGDFGADGPVFQVDAPPPNPLTPSRRNRRSIAWLALFSVITGAAVWLLQPWAAPTLHVPVPDAAIEIAEAPAAPPPASTSVTTAPLPPPEPVPAAVIEIAETSATRPTASPSAAIPLPVPELPSAPDLEIRLAVLPPRHFPDSPVLALPEISLNTPKTGSAPGTLSSLAIPAALPLPNAAIAAAPSAPPILEPAPLAHDPVTAWNGPLPELHPLGPASPTAPQEIPSGMDSGMKAPLPATGITLLADNGITFLKAPTAPVVEPPEPALVTAQTAEATPAALPVPIPVPRPTRSAPVAETPVSDPESPLAKILPPPKPARLGQPATEPGATIAANAPANAPASTPADVPAIIPDHAPVAAPPATSATPATSAPNQTEDPDTPTKYASLTAPRPITRPVLPVLPRILTSTSTLPALTGTIRRSIQAAATESGLPLKQTTLIGILSLDTGRKALLRLPNGHYRAVIVGDVLDGWQVSMIGVDAMHMTRSGEDVTLLLVNR